MYMRFHIWRLFLLGGSRASPQTSLFDFGFRSFRVIRASGCPGVWVTGCPGIRVSGNLGVRVSGYIWVSGYPGARVSGIGVSGYL